MEKDILLKINNLHANVEGKNILNGISMEVKKGEICALMGPNGSGKSTLSQVIAGNPLYEVTEGDIYFNDGNELINITEMSPDERAQLGIFLAFQYPVSIPGVPLGNFLRQIYNTVHKDKKLTPLKFKEYLKEKMEILNMDDSYLERSLNDGFSGGEKKKAEILQLAVLNPKLAILDETDSGLDIDALRQVSDSVNKLKQANPDLTIVIITHYQRILSYIKPNSVNIAKSGKIVVSGGPELVDKLESEGYSNI